MRNPGSGGRGYMRRRILEVTESRGQEMWRQRSGTWRYGGGDRAPGGRWRSRSSFPQGHPRRLLPARSRRYGGPPRCSTPSSRTSPLSSFQSHLTCLASICQECTPVVDGIEFARGDPGTSWGSVRAAMGHPEPFQLNYISIGNQEYSMHYYKENYRKFYSAIKASYPDIKIISSCDRSTISPVEPADLYDVHVYTSSGDMFSKSRMFDSTPRGGPKAIVSEYAVTGNDAGRGTLVAALAEAAFLIGLERNSDVVEMASCAPLFVNENDRRWSPDAIVFNSWQHYGCPNYWMLHFFKDSSGAALHPSTIQVSNYNQLVASSITWQNSKDGNTYLKIKVLNFGDKTVDIGISITGLENDIQTFGSIKTVLTSGSLRDENSFQQPDKVVPVESPITNAREQMSLVLDPYSLTSVDLLLDPNTKMHSFFDSNLHSSM